MRLLLKRDAEQIEELENLIFPDESMNALQIETEIGLGFGLVEGEEVPRGYILCRASPGLVDILRLGVVPAHRGKGIASLLLKAVMNHPGQTMLSVVKENKPALQLYKKYGFRIIGELKENRWVMLRASS